MSSLLWRKFYLCLPKFKCLPTSLSHSSPFDEEENVHQNQKSHHNNINIDDDRHGSSLSASAMNILKNFNSLYDDSTSNNSKSLTSSSTTTDQELLSSSDDSESDAIPDFATVFASRRFFFSSPGRSNSIIESPETPQDDSVVSGGVAVQTYSPDPFADFRRSMQEMVEARELTDLRGEWDFLHELLLCYLSLNPKHTHKFIVRAFADLIVSLMSSSTTLEVNTRDKR